MKGIDIRSSDSLIFRVFLQDADGVIVTTGTTTIRLYRVAVDGSLESYDWDDGLFKSTVLTQEAAELTHQTGNNGTTDTGIWTLKLTPVLVNWNLGDIIIVQIDNSLASPTIQTREFQFAGEVPGQVDLLDSAINKIISGPPIEVDSQGRIEATGNWAVAGNKMDLVDGPNGTAIAAIKTGLGTVPASGNWAVPGDIISGPPIEVDSQGRVTATGNWAVAGNKMDLVDAPNGTAIAAIKTGLGTVPASGDWAKTAEIIDGPPIEVDSQGRVTAANESTGPVTLATSQPNYAPAKAGDEMNVTVEAIAQINGGDLQGDGSVTVDHNTGGTDHLTYQYEGVGVSGGVIRAYLKSEYDANTIDEKGMAYTGASGRWTSPMYLDPGTYYLVFTKPGVYGPTIVTEIIA